MNTKTEGNAGEQAACAYLQEQGYEILERNYKCRLGEIDIIAFKDNTVVFTEVKARHLSGSGYAEEAVPFVKQRKICRTADHYRMKQGLTERVGFRFDVIAINHGVLKHYENAFPYCGTG